MNLQQELAEVAAMFSATPVTFPDGIGLHRLGVRVPHAHRSIIARYAPDHPLSPPWVYIDPPPSNSHYYLHSLESYARLCWCRPEQWDPTYHLIVAVGAAITFLNEEFL
jgi:hypothetical protein